MLSALRSNKAQLKNKSRSKFNGLGDEEHGVYKGKIKERTYSPAQIQAAKDAFQEKVKARKKKTLIAVIITAVVSIAVCYAITQLYLYSFT